MMKSRHARGRLRARASTPGLRPGQAPDARSPFGGSPAELMRGWRSKRWKENLRGTRSHIERIVPRNNYHSIREIPDTRVPAAPQRPRSGMTRYGELARACSRQAMRWLSTACAPACCRQGRAQLGEPVLRACASWAATCLACPGLRPGVAAFWLHLFAAQKGGKRSLF